MKRRVLVLVDDLFFAAKIRATAEHLGVEVIFPRSKEALDAAAKPEAPRLSSSTYTCSATIRFSSPPS